MHLGKQWFGINSTQIRSAASLAHFKLARSAALILHEDFFLNRILLEPAERSRARALLILKYESQPLLSVGLGVLPFANVIKFRATVNGLGNRNIVIG